jgi:predicted NUDIX family phosphoesterase
MMTADKAEERVLGVPREALRNDGLLIQGFRAQPLDGLLGLVAARGVFRRRSEAEEDPDWKQIIPYAVVRSGARIFLMRRSAQGAEARLHHRFSIGVGGHINPGEAEPERRVLDGLERELDEELVWPAARRVQPIGILNDDSSDVGRVHFGIVFLVDVEEPAVAVRETDLLDGRFVEADELSRSLEAMESWSRFIAGALLDGKLRLPRPGGGGVLARV